MVFLCRKEKLQKGSYLWLAQIVLFWIAAGFIGNQLKNDIEIQKNLNSINFIVLSIFSTSLFLIILKPLATFTTGIFKNRKIWIQISSVIMIFILIITSISDLPLWLTIIIIMLFSFSLASSTLFYLFSNEQNFFRIYTLPSIWITFVFITFSSSFGIYLSNSNLVYKNNGFSISLIVILSILVVLGFAISFLSKENKNLVQVFDEEILNKLPQKNNMIFLIIYLLGFLITLTSAMNNSIFIKLYIALNLINFDLNEEQVNLWLRINDFVYLVPTIITSIISYKLLRKVIEQKYLIFISMFILFGTYTAMAFVPNPFIFIALNILAGICFNQIIYSLFSACVFWNYRAKRNPVTGYFGSAMFGSYFITELIENFISGKKIGIFKNFTNVDELLDKWKNIEQSSKTEILIMSDNISTIIMSIACVLILASILLFYFTSSKIFADYSKYKIATQNLKILIKKRVMTKTKTKFKVEIFEEGESENYE
ncbi:MFS transporter [Spiroplasma diminutum]|nr:MFS transporter [Spiroplasma diminutum]